MRLAVAVAAGAAAQLAVYLRFAGAVEGTPAVVLAYIVLAASGAGFFAARRGALAGALSVLLAATLYAAVTLLGPMGAGMGALDRFGTGLGVVSTFWPYVAIGAVAGALGSTLRARIVARR